MDLAFTEYSDYGTSPTNESPIIITHGLLGSKANWHSLSKAINKSTGRKVMLNTAAVTVCYILVACGDCLETL